MLQAEIFELIAPRELVVREESLPLDRLGPREVAARTIVSTISPGTELAAYRGDPPLRPGKVYPRLVGYCNVAEVVAIGAEVQDIAVGDRVLSFQSHRSSFVVASDRLVLRVPADMDPVEASTTYLFHLGYDALLKGNLLPGKTVAVVGLGTLGMATVAVARAAGARVWAISSQDSSLELASRLGAVPVRKADAGGLGKRVREETADAGIDLVVSTSNSWEDWRLTVALPRKGGVVSVLGFPGRGLPPSDFNPLDSQYFYDNQLTLIACGYAPDLEIPAHDIRFTIRRNCHYLLDLIKTKQLPARSLVSTIAPWQDLGDVYELLDARKAAFTASLQWT